jgi:Ca2+-binding EF-hand superfamily protein
MADINKDDIYREFQEYDRDKNGFVSLSEAEEVLAKRFGFSHEQTKHYLTICDKNQDGQLSYGEFVDFYIRIKEKISEIGDIFRSFDVNGDGVVSTAEAKEAMTSMNFSEAEIEMLVDTYDLNRDGKLQYEEFIKFWMGK